VEEVGVFLVGIAPLPVLVDGGSGVGVTGNAGSAFSVVSSKILYGVMINFCCWLADADFSAPIPRVCYEMKEMKLTWRNPSGWPAQPGLTWRNQFLLVTQPNQD
jgi:hypothetical protein